jgi:hypothetical protein
MLSLLHRFQEGFRVQTPRGSLPGFPSGDLATRIPSITDGHSLAPRSFTRIAIGCSHDQPTTREPYGLTTFHTNDRIGLGSLCPPAACLYKTLPMTGDTQAPVPAALPFWLRPKSILGRFSLTTFIQSSHRLAMPPTLAPHRLMLADTSSPHGLDAPFRGGIRCRRALDGSLPYRPTS